MSDKAIYESASTNAEIEEEIFDSASPIDFSDDEGTIPDTLLIEGDDVPSNKYTVKLCPSTICIHTTALLADKVSEILGEFDTHAISMFTSTLEITSTGTDDINTSSDATFTQHITAKFNDANEADACYSKLRDLIPRTQYNIEISYEALSHPGNLYVRFTNFDLTQDELREIFEQYGELTTCKIVYNEENKSKGYGFVNFVLKTSADRAIEELNDQEIDGNQFYINHHISRKERIEKLELEKVNYTNLYVKNIPEGVTSREIADLFSQFGTVVSIFLPTVDNDDDDDDDNDNNENDKNEANNENDENNENNEKMGKLKGFGFVNFETHADAITAQRSLNNYEIYPGHHIMVTKALKREKGGAGAGTGGDQPASNASATASMESFARDFGRLRMYQQQGSGQPPPMQAGNYYSASPGALQAQLPPPQYYYPPPPPPSQIPRLYTPPMKNGLPIAGPNYQDSNLYIKNLPMSVGDDELTALFEPFGEIVSAKVITSDGEHSKGYGFVCFKSPQHASRALVQMANYPLDEYHVLHVSFAQRKDNRVGPNGIVHHYNQNHFAYGGGRAGINPINIMPSSDAGSSQQQQQQQAAAAAPYPPIFPYYYYPQAPNGKGYGQMPPPSSYPPGTPMLAMPPMAQQQQQQPQAAGAAIPKSSMRQYGHYAAAQAQQQPPKSPLVLSNYSVDYYGRVVPSGAVPRYVAQQQAQAQQQQQLQQHQQAQQAQVHQQHKYQMPPQ